MKQQACVNASFMYLSLPLFRDRIISLIYFNEKAASAL